MRVEDANARHTELADPYEVNETGRERRSRKAYFVSKPIKGPVFLWASVHQSERLADMSIAQTGKPTPRIFRQRLDVFADGFYEQKLTQFREDRLAPRTSAGAFGDCDPKEVGDPAVTPVQSTGAEDRRQR